MKNRIYFFANFGDWSKIPFGGGEVGNRRTLALLKKLNYDIVLIPKYIRVNDHSLINSIELFEILNKHISVLEGSNENLKSIFYKMICYYDFLKYYKKK